MEIDVNVLDWALEKRRDSGCVAQCRRRSPFPGGKRMIERERAFLATTARL